MSNTYGNFYGYTGVFPIINDKKRNTSHARSLRSLLSDMDNGGGSLFSRTGLIHGARLFVLDDVVYNGHPSKEEHLEYEYLVFSLTFDGELDEMAQRLSEYGGNDFESVFQHCYGFDAGNMSSEFMLKFLQTGQITTSFLYVEADGDLQETMRALLAKRYIAQMLEKAQFLTTEEKKALVRTTASSIASAALPLPGDFDERGAL